MHKVIKFCAKTISIQINIFDFVTQISDIFKETKNITKKKLKTSDKRLKRQNIYQILRDLKLYIIY